MSSARYIRWLYGSSAAWCIAGALPLLLSWQALPEPMASHWGIRGEPNGSLPKLALLGIHVGCVLLPALLLRPSASRDVRAVAAIGLGTVSFAGALTLALSASGVWLNRGHARWQEAGSLNATLVLATLLLAGLSGAGAFALARRAWPPLGPVPSGATEPLPLSRDERAFWSGSARNRWQLLLLAYLAAQAGAFMFMLGRTAALAAVLTHVLAVVAVEAFSALAVSVDERALTIRYGHLGLFRQRVPLERVAAASAFELVPMEHGGWGYRGNLRWLNRAAVVVRRGAALRLDLAGGKRLSITVDDADTAARLISAFVGRRGQPAASSGTRPNDASAAR